MGNDVIGYVSAQAGLLKNAHKENILTPQIVAGAKVSTEQGWFGKGEIGYGTGLHAKVEAGKAFEMTDSFEFTTSVGGQYYKSNKERDYYSKCFEVEKNQSPTWKPSDLRGYANAGVNFKGNWGNVGIGVQGGVKHSSTPLLQPGQLDYNIGQVIDAAENSGKKTKFYATPTVTTKINMGKCWSFNADVSLEQGSIGIAYNF